MTDMIESPEGVPIYIKGLLDMDEAVFLSWVKYRTDNLLELIGFNIETVPTPIVLLLETAISAHFCAGVEFARAKQMEPLEKAVAAESYDPDAD